MSTRLYVFALIAALSAQARAADEPSGYLVVAADGAPVTTASGACVRTSQWNTEASYRECDPRPIVAEMKIVEAAPRNEPSNSHIAPFKVSMNTLFDFGSAELRSDAGPALDGLVKQLTSGNYQKVDIVGHADRMGPGKYNQKLSEDRAAAVRDYLLSRGLDGTKVSAIGVGATEPLTGKECRGLLGKPLVYCLQRDRSTEITVLGTQTSAMR